MKILDKINICFEIGPPFQISYTCTNLVVILAKDIQQTITIYMHVYSNEHIGLESDP